MSEWTEIKFGELLITRVKNGIYKSKEFHGTGCKIVNMGELFSNPRLYNIPMQRVLLTNKEKEKYLLKNGDLIFARRSLTAEGAGKCSIVKEVTEDTTFESSIIKAEPNHDLVSSDFLFYCFNSPYGRYLLGTILRQVAVAGITGSDLMELSIPIPPLPEQKTIAGVLSILDDKIDLLHRQNKTLEAMAETLFKQWFIEEAEDDWEVGTIIDEFRLTMGQSPASTTFNTEGIGIPMFQGNADFGFRFPKNRIYTTEPTRLAEKFDTLVSVRAPVGAQNMASEKCCLGRGVAAFRYNADSTFYTYTYYKLMSLMDNIKSFNDEGTVFGSIGKHDFESMRMTIPPYTLINEYENYCKSINDKIIKNCQQINKLESILSILLPRLISGDVRVMLDD